MKKKRDHLKPYIRKAKKADFRGDRAIDLRTCFEAIYWSDQPKCYVLVQKHSKKILAFGASKMEIKRRIFPRKKHINRNFHRWCNKITKYAQK